MDELLMSFHFTVREAAAAGRPARFGRHISCTQRLHRGDTRQINDAVKALSSHSCTHRMQAIEISVCAKYHAAQQGVDRREDAQQNR